MQVYDKDRYINSDGEVFRFRRQRDVEVNWRQVRQFDSEFQELSNLYQSYEGFGLGSSEGPAGDSLRGSADMSSHILQNMDAIAYCDFEADRNGRWLSAEGKQVIKIMQFAM